MFKLDIEKGDIIYTGRFKNKKTVVKSIGYDENGQPIVNGKPMLKFKIEKLMPDKKEKTNEWDEWQKKKREK